LTIETKYNRALERWLNFAGWLSLDLRRKKQHTLSKMSKVYFESALVQAESSALFKLTLLMITLVFSWLLVSCQSTTTHKKPLRLTRPEEAIPKQPDVLYLKRDNLSIKPRYQGSTTGSIWADAQAPRELIADARPNRAGEMVNVRIPESLRFAAFPSSQRSSTDKSSADKSSTDKTSNSASPGDGMTPPSAPHLASVGGPAPESQPSGTAPLLANTHFAATQEFKMQIVALDPQGDAFLRGTRTFSGSSGELRTLTLLAKVPARDLSSYEVSAQSLAEISLVETVGGQSSEYIASGWDTNVSRSLSGWVPDLEAQADLFEGQRRELDMVRSSLKEQQKSLLQEKERMLGERKRNNEQIERFQEALTKSQQSQQAQQSPQSQQAQQAQQPQGAPGSNGQPQAANAANPGGNPR
jgi:hypothetical protein